MALTFFVTRQQPECFERERLSRKSACSYGTLPLKRQNAMSRWILICCVLLLDRGRGRTMLMEDVDGYLALRRSLGFPLHDTERLLRSFVRAAVAAHDTHIVGSTAIRWAGESATEGMRNKRLRIVCKFARFMHAEDSRHEIPPDNVYCGQRPRVAPYIFTDEELRQISREAQRLGPPGSLRPFTFDALFSLLAATGMRPSEWPIFGSPNFPRRESSCVRRSSERADSSPFTRAQWLPSKLTWYVGCKRVADDHVFISTGGRGLSKKGVQNVFRQVLRHVKYQKHLSHAHLDLWISATLLLYEHGGCPDGRGGVRQHMLALSTYMGHSHSRYTYWYLENTPELMRDIADVTEAFVYGGDK